MESQKRMHVKMIRHKFAAKAQRHVKAVADFEDVLGREY